MQAKFKQAGLRVAVDRGSERLAKQIRTAEKASALNCRAEDVRLHRKPGHAFLISTGDPVRTFGKIFLRLMSVSNISPFDLVLYRKFWATGPRGLMSPKTSVQGGGEPHYYPWRLCRFRPRRLLVCRLGGFG